MYYFGPNVTQILLPGLTTKGVFQSAPINYNWRNGATHNGNVYLMSTNLSSTTYIYRLNVASNTLASTGAGISSAGECYGCCEFQGNIYISDTRFGGPADAISIYNISTNSVFQRV